MTKIDSIKTETYDCGGGFRVDILTTGEGYDAYIYHKDYGIKSQMFGSPFEQVYGPVTPEAFLELVEGNVDEYIEGYREDYMED